MDAQRIETIKQELIFRETQDLIDIWIRHDRDEWTDEAFEAVRLILLAELGYLPSYDQPEEAVKHLVRAQEHLSLDAPEKALEECELAIQCDPHNSTAYNARGMIYDDLGMLELAVESYQEAIRLDPENKDARVNLKYAKKEMEEVATTTNVPSINYRMVFSIAWSILWKSKYPLFLGFLYMGIASLSTILKDWRLLACLIAPIELLVHSMIRAGIIQSIHDNITNTITTIPDIWKTARRAGWRILVMAFLLGLLLIPVFFMGFALFRTNLVHGLLLPIYIVPVVLLLYSVGIFFSLVEIVIVINQTAIIESPIKAMRFLIQGFSKIIILQGIFFAISFLITSVNFAITLSLYHIPFRLDISSYLNLTVVFTKPFFLIVNGLLQTILFPFSYSLLIVLYQWINKNEEAPYPQVVQSAP